MKNTVKNDIAVFVVQWILILPASMLAALFAGIVSGVFFESGIKYQLPPGDEIGERSFMHAWLVLMTQGGAGAAFVFFGTKVAFVAKEFVFYFLAVVGGAIGLGAGAFFYWESKDWWYSYEACCWIVGVGWMTYKYYRGEIVP